MPRPRKALMCLNTTPYYHCTSRCVRRAFLCGKDKKTGQSFEHRRQWIEDKLFALAKAFAIDICAYAIMHNHYHIVFHVDKQEAEDWSTLEVVKRWHQVCKGNLISQRFVRGESLNTTEKELLKSLVVIWRKRLIKISWLQGKLNESIARMANKEDNCTGKFWEARFSCQALLDEKALAACAVYVDLNPIRAKMAHSLEESDHTSIQRRCQQARQAAQPNHPQQQTKGLMPFVGNLREGMPKGLPFKLTDYLALADWTGRILRDGKQGNIGASTPPILTKLNIDPKHWCYLCQHFESRFKILIGSAYAVKAACHNMGLRWAQGINACRESFPA